LTKLTAKFLFIKISKNP